MSHPHHGLIECSTIQDKLDGHFLSVDPGQIREAIPLIEFLTSKVNTSGMLQKQVSAGNGKIRDIELVYEPRFLESGVSTSAVQACTSSNEAGQRSHVYNLDTTVGSEINRFYRLTDLATICEADPEFINRQVQKMMDAAIRKMATTTWGQVAALTGVFAAGVSANGANELVVKTKQATALGAGIDTDFIEQISFATMDMAYPSRPYIFGYGEAHKAFRRVKAGCCATSGLDVGSFAIQEDMVFFTDYRAEGAFGAGHFISTAAGAMQLLTYNEYDGYKGVRTIDTEVYKQIQVKDPATGIPFDLMWKFDCGVIYIQIKLAHKLVGAPTDMFFSADRLAGVTFVNEYLITNPA